MRTTRICIIGCGNMGGSLAIGLAKGGAVQLRDILLFDHSVPKARQLARSTGARAAQSASQAVRWSDVVIVAVKPFAVEDLLAALGPQLAGKLLVSIAAGKTTRFLEARTPKKCRVAVAMPNIAMRTGRGVCYYFLGQRTNGEDAKTVHRLLSSAACAVRVRKESGISRAYIASSGIAFFYLAIEGMARAGQRKGMRRPEALALAARAAEGAGAMLLATDREPDELAAMVATKKGTTVEGLKVLQRMRVKAAFMNATLASMRKAEKLAKKR